MITNELSYFRAHRENIALHMANSSHEVLVAAGGAKGIDVQDWPRSMRLVGLDLHRHRLMPLRDLKLMLHLRKIIQNEQPDLIHAITIKPILFSALALMFSTQQAPSIVWTFPGLGKVFEPQQTLYGRFRQMAVTTALKLAKRRLNITATFENDDDRQRMVALGLVEADRAHALMGTGLSKKTYAYKPDLKPNDGQPVVLLATRLLKSKGVDTFIQAAERLQGKLTFQLAGPRDESNPDCMPMDVIQEAQQRGCLTYLGALDDKGVVRAMTKADIYCLPTRLREGFPRSLMEAAALKCCLVASDQNTIRRLVDDNETGILLRSSTAEELCNALSELADNPAEISKMGDQAQKLALSLPIWDDDIIAAFSDVYQNALEGAQ